MRNAKTLRALAPILAALIALAFAATAQADYEQVGNFGNESDESRQFGGITSGGAVNITGAGGVEPGSVYFSIKNFGNRILRYSPKGEFKEAWGWGITKNSTLLNEQFERCGPALGTECRLDGGNNKAGSARGEIPVSEENTTNCGTATDSAGDLYVVDREGAGRVYGPDGTQLTEFKFGTNSSFNSDKEICNLAVDSSGAIYAVARRIGASEPSEVLKLEPIGGTSPPTSATKYTKGSTIYGNEGIVAMASEHGIASVAVNPANQHIYTSEAAGDEIQVFKKPSEAFKLKCEGNETASLEADATEVEIRKALEAVNCGTVSVSEHVVFGNWGVTFKGSLAETQVGKLEVIKAGGNELAKELAIGSSSPHVTVYEPNGTRLETITPSISGADYYGIGVYGTNGDIYVADKAHDKAYVLSSSGSLKTEISGSGCEKGAFAVMEAPTLAVDQSNGNVLVSDINGHGVVDEFDSSGNCLLSINHPFAEARPSAIAIDNSGGANNRVAYVASKNGATSSVYAYAAPSGSARAELSAFSHEEPGSFGEPQGMAIDQQTGYVYVVNKTRAPVSQNETYIRVHDLVEVFSADGSERIAHFGDAPNKSETLAGSPGKLNEPMGITVGQDGTVYVGAGGGEGVYPSRVMCFRPQSPGDYEHYVYCGRSQDIEINDPRYLASDDDGNLYVGNQELVSELAPGEPTALLCTFATHGQAYSMTTNPQTGEVFYFNFSDKSVHRLKPCEPEKGKFAEAQAKVKVSPPTAEISGLAFNPTLSWGPGRPQGVLYGADYEPHEIGGVTHQGLGYVLAQAGALSPAVLSESFSDARTASAVLRAEIDPNGFATHYAFQYLTATQYEANAPTERFVGAIEAPAGGGTVGAGAVGSVAAAITGLTPDTAYRFRVIATSECNGKGGEPCVAEGKALGFATYPLFPPGLPDHRVYELVSPAQKHGGEVLPAEPTVNSCFATNRECKPKSFGSPFPMQASPDGEALAYEGQPFNPLEGAVRFDSYVARRTANGWQSTALIPALPSERVKQASFDSTLGQGLLSVEGSEAQAERDNLEIQPTTEPGMTTPLITGEPPNRSTGGSNGFAISYGGHSADFSRIFFAANDTLSEETSFAPEPPDPGASKNDLYEWHEGQLTVVNVAPGNATVLAGAKFASLSPDTHAVSEDGSRVYFKDEAGSLYVREQGEVTRLINDPGHFLSATPDGSEVLLDDGCLYSIESESCNDLTEGKGGFQGLVGQSKDLSHIYFIDTEVVATNEGASLDSKGNPQVAEAGKANLYEWSGSETRFTAQLLSGRDSADWTGSPVQRTAEASPNGRFLAFASLAPLTGYDNFGLCSIEEEGFVYKPIPGPCTEAFLYDSANDKLACASCNPTGEAPLGNTTLRRIEPGFAPEQFPQPRYLTDEGRLYFDTQDSLTARDTNEGVEDVYEFSPQGAGAQGTCEREGGCIRLISAGTEAVDSNLIAVDETGRNVFFDTRDRLSLKDKDELLDIYDAREGGGIAAESEISRAECQGENCQAPVSPPNDPTPASSSFEGAGNVKEPPVAKKHAKKKHAKKHKKAKKHAKHSRTAKRNHGGAK